MAYGAVTTLVFGAAVFLAAFLQFALFAASADLGPELGRWAQRRKRVRRRSGRSHLDLLLLQVASLGIAMACIVTRQARGLPANVLVALGGVYLFGSLETASAGWLFPELRRSRTRWRAGSAALVAVAIAAAIIMLPLSD